MNLERKSCQKKEFRFIYFLLFLYVMNLTKQKPSTHRQTSDYCL